MYHGNVSGQYNNSGLPPGQEYTSSMYAARPMSHPGQPVATSMHGQMTQGQAGPSATAQAADLQQLQTVSGFPGPAQASYGTSQPNAYGTDPYMYNNHPKMVAQRGNAAQNYGASINPSPSATSHLYVGVQGQSRLPSVYSASSDLQPSTDGGMPIQGYGHPNGECIGF